MIHLGAFSANKIVRDGVLPGQIDLEIHYEKDAADTARLDVVWLVPRDEPQMNLYAPADAYLNVGYYWAISRTETFDYEGIEGTPTLMIDPLHLRGDEMVLQPRIENRCYFVCETLDSPDDIYEAHAIAGAPPSVEMIVNLDYLPQFISPLE